MHSGDLTIVKVNATDGDVLEGWRNSTINAPIDKIYVSISSNSESLFFTSTNPDGYV
jgi:hypothetical protein